MPLYHADLYRLGDESELVELGFDELLERSDAISLHVPRSKETLGLLGREAFEKVRPGVLRRALPDWLDFFRPGFHPWMHDNREFLDQAEALMDEVAAFDVNRLQAA